MVISLLEAALPRRQIGLIAFNDRLCHSAAELRSVILKARAVALENAKHERAAAAFKNRLLAELARDRAVRRAAREKAPCSLVAITFSHALVPYLPFGIPVGIGSVRWKTGLRRCCLWVRPWLRLTD